ncbi:para-nitrobenzyl esterase [Microbacterium sp. cf046]|uniref:carboxylesterase/lipase family protein n=1 Tax=Microbacterium sp. cf046 TaxID=1761803 RepID=UPI0008DF7F06|nr:carboxylesterase family protein [Microbacterium sp. cf046]SFS01334.1 para-nitrobenzyl esterase [Microbacterium sp. cf046]
MTDTTVLTVSHGAVRGVRDGGIDRYLGIPYAAAPFGDRRFMPPAPVAAWDGVRDAIAFGPTAPQAPYGGGLEKYLPTVAIAGDDILTVNVWTPADRAPGASLPVLVFVHGGALTRGSAALPGYDGSTFAAAGVVYVSVQYRVGQEGFAVLDDVPQNLGVLDQEAALRWVRSEIGVFGGDPERVTAMGHSAGASTLTALLALPQAEELFDRVILQSGPLNGQPPDKAGRMTRAIAKRLGVAPTRAGFAGIEPATLVAEQAAVAAAGSPLGGAPTVTLAIGGVAVPVDPLAALIDGAARGIPVMIGSTSEEYRLWFVPSGRLGKIRRSTLTIARITARVPARIVRAHRLRRPEATPGEVLGEVMSDMLLRGPLTRFADSRTDAEAPTYVYEFRWRSPLDDMGAAHAMELGFVFDRLTAPDSIALGGPDAPQALADAMHRAWIAFVVEGDPGWERWSTRQPVLAFDADGGHIDYAPRADELVGLPSR